MLVLVATACKCRISTCKCQAAIIEAIAVRLYVHMTACDDHIEHYTLRIYLHYVKMSCVIAMLLFYIVCHLARYSLSLIYEENI